MTPCDSAVIALLPLCYLPIYHAIHGAYVLPQVHVEFSVCVYWAISSILFGVLRDVFLFSHVMALWIIFVPVIGFIAYLCIRLLFIKPVYSIIWGLFAIVPYFVKVNTECADEGSKYTFIALLLVMAVAIMAFRKRIVTALNPQRGQKANERVRQ